MKKILSILLASALLFTFSCQDNEKQFITFLNQFDTLMVYYISAKNHPKRKLPNKTLADFIRHNKTTISKTLEKIYQLRLNNKKEFFQLYKKHKSKIVSVFKKLQMLDPEIRILFQYFSFVFSPEDISFNKERLIFFRSIFLKYCELLEKSSGKKAK